jgi:hypothetical protein
MVNADIQGCEYVGGLAGLNQSGVITSCHVTGSVSGTGDYTSIGGLVGLNSEGIITSCYMEGLVIGNGETSSIGGLVGDNWGTIVSCYATAAVTGTDNWSAVGGLVGNNNSGTITSCYATGDVSGNYYVGGLVGSNYGSLTACFWDTQASDMTDGVGNMDPDPNGVTGKTTAEMQTQSTFTDAGWDFSDTDGDPADWQMSINDYPRLAWQQIIPGASTGRILWQAVKAPYYGDIMYAIHPRITISGMKTCSLKGPNMADFASAVWIPQTGQWSLEMWPFTLTQLQQEALGMWELKLTDNDDRESIYSFNISGMLQDSEFLPIPFITEPVLFAPNVIAEHYTLRWNPNGAQNSADALIAVIAGNGFYYYSNSLDLSTTEWNPGWLEIGEAYCRVCYADYRPDMMDTPSLVSGPAIGWESAVASLVSGPAKPFTIKYSLDFNDDDRIDLADLTAFCSHWLEPAPSVADFDDGGTVEFGDFAICAQHWLEDVNNIADHVFEIGIDTEWDYGAPGISDDAYVFGMEVYTDDTVVRIEVETPGGNTFEIPNTPLADYQISGGTMEKGREFDAESGHYIWMYGPEFDSPDSLSAYGDGLYTFTIYFAGGRVQQTTSWFGIPGTTDPIPQPMQEPVFTSFNHGDTVSSPVTFAWQDCNDPAAEYILLETDDNIPGSPMEFILPVDANGLDEPLYLTPGLWDDFELSFERFYEYSNTDGIPVHLMKQSESDYVITVTEGDALSDHVFEIEIESGISFDTPFNPTDDNFAFEVDILTDNTVDRIEFTAPAGNTFEIPNSPLTEGPIPGGWLEVGREFDAESGRYNWCYSPSFENPDSLLDYGDGLYTVTIYFVGGRVQQTTAWFGVPGTTDPIPQPTQEPVFTSISHGETVTSPVEFSWNPCVDPAAEFIRLSIADFEEILPVNSNGLPYMLYLDAGVWETELDFEIGITDQNSDGITIHVGKYSDNNIYITVAGSIADLNGDGKVDDVDLVVLANQWLQSPGNPSADIAPQPSGDGIVNFEDFAQFAQHWLEGV